MAIQTALIGPILSAFRWLGELITKVFLARFLIKKGEQNVELEVLKEEKKDAQEAAKRKSRIDSLPIDDIRNVMRPRKKKPSNDDKEGD
jgi:hypothetical protein